MENIFEDLIGFFLVILIIFLLWVIPICLGLKWAKIKGVSKLWMLFWIPPNIWMDCIFILKYGIDPRKQCDKCKESIKIDAQICRYCGNQLNQEEINNSLKEFEDRKK